MTDKTTIQTNVDTFNDGGSYFVRAEIEARSVNIHGPYPDLQTAQKLQADQTALLAADIGGAQGAVAARNSSPGR